MAGGSFGSSRYRCEDDFSPCMDFGFGDAKLIGFNFRFWVSSTDDQRRPEIDYF
jgi:hypothetical protein